MERTDLRLLRIMVKFPTGYLKKKGCSQYGEANGRFLDPLLGLQISCSKLRSESHRPERSWTGCTAEDELQLVTLWDVV